MPCSFSFILQFRCQNSRFSSGKIWLEGFAPCKKIVNVNCYHIRFLLTSKAIQSSSFLIEFCRELDKKLVWVVLDKLVSSRSKLCRITSICTFHYPLFRVWKGSWFWLFTHFGAIKAPFNVSFDWRELFLWVKRVFLLL